MNQVQLIDKVSFSVAGAVLVFGFFLFYSQTDEPIGSFAAAFIAACLAWASYVLIRLIVLALKK